MPEDDIHAETIPARKPARPSGWHLLISALLSLGVVVLAITNRAWLLEALRLARAVQPLWLAAALLVVLLSYLISSQVFRVVLRSLGYQIGVVRMWMTAIVAIMLSQSVPAGGVGSYAFLLNGFRRCGVSTTQATLVASLEVISYGGAMFLISGFGLLFLLTNALSPDITGMAFLVPLMALLVLLLLLGSATVLFTRSEEVITGWLLTIKNSLPRLLRRSWDDARVQRVAAELVRGRDLVTSRRSTLGLLVLIQCVALCGHSLALLLILLSLGVQTSFLVVLSVFGIVLVTSTLNVLPGGGGTVEAVLIATLNQFVADPAVVPAAIIFRLLNFWLLLPLAAGGYYWLMQQPLCEEPEEIAVPQMPRD